MVNDEIGKNARLLIKDNKVKQVSENMWEVGDEIVRKISKPGRSFFTCTCDSYCRNCSSPRGSRCYHVESIIIFNPEFQERINKVIEIYENAEKIDMKPDNIVIIQELKDLKYFK